MKLARSYLCLILAFCCYAAMCGGCRTTPVMLRCASVINDSGDIIRNVRVRHEQTMKEGRASAIPPGTALDLCFSVQPLLSENATVLWEDSRGRPQQASLALPHAKSAGAGSSFHLLYRIDPAGSVSVTLEP